MKYEEPSLEVVRWELGYDVCTISNKTFDPNDEDSFDFEKEFFPS